VADLLTRRSTLLLSSGDPTGAEVSVTEAITIRRRASGAETSRDLGLAITGPYGTLHAYDSSTRKDLDAATGVPVLGYITEMALFAQAPPIYGGTDQVQRNIIGERVLGLPKEPNNDRTMTWSELPKNG